ncbi:MAG: SMC family ATPase [Prolixibacteraceae bacterium]
MIPVKLSIQGLYSYQEKQTIDFSKLTSAHLFGIFGSVGSGKSSILEAITFAVYGDTDRMNSRDSRNYNMMNLKSNELLIDFEFETGKNQIAYRAVVKGRRNSKKFEDVKTFERTAYQNENGTWMPVETETLVREIGLSYDNFKRTIIIPQGQFQEFLQLGSTDRTRMMKELFNLQKFELYYKVVSLETKNNAEKQTLEGQLKQLGEIDPEQAKLFAEKLNQLKVEIEVLNRQIHTNQKLDADMKNLLELVRKRDETQLKSKVLSDRIPEITELENKIADYEYGVIHFKNLFEASGSAKKKIQQLEEKLRTDSENLKKANDQIELNEQEFVKIKTEYDQLDNYKRRAEELEKLAKLIDLKVSAGKLEDRVKKGEGFVSETNQKIEEFRKEKTKLEAGLKEEKAKQPDMLVLSNVKSWHELHKNLQQQQISTAAEELKSKADLQVADQVILRIFDAALFSSFSGEKNTFAGIDFLKQRIFELKNQVSGFESRIQHFNVQLKLEEYAVALKEGDTCPVCGSLHHPEIFSSAHVSDELSKVLDQKKGLEKEISDCENEISGLVEKQHYRNSTEQQLTSILNRKKELDEKTAAHQSLFKWDNFRNEEDVSRAFVTAENLRKSVAEFETQLDSTAKKLDQEIANREKFALNIEKLKSDSIAAKTEINTLTAQIKLIDLTAYSEKSTEEILREKERLLEKYAKTVKDFEAVTNQLTALRKNKDILSGSISANQVQLEQEKTLLAEFSVQIETAVKNSEFESVESVLQVLKQELNLVAEKQKVNQFRQEISNTRNQLELLITEIGDRKYDLEIHQEIRLKLEKDQEQLNLKNRESGVIEKSLADILKAMEEQQDLRANLEKLMLRAENIKTMKSLFTASGFVNYISSVYLQNLCQAANDRFFQLTRQKLSLEISGDNNFQVRDYLNGGKVRSVKTLSGGQTFQAALCLALALADNIQQITESNQNFFFLDEGFGSLDKESLSIVFDALKSLRKENRIVGVISHVEEMQQEIDVHLRIVNEEDRGSKILSSWTV